MYYSIVFALLLLLWTSPVLSQELPTLTQLGDGTLELSFVDGTLKRIHPDGHMTIISPAGPVLTTGIAQATGLADAVVKSEDAATSSASVAEEGLLQSETLDISPSDRTEIVELYRKFESEVQDSDLSQETIQAMRKYLFNMRNISPRNIITLNAINTKQVVPTWQEDANQIEPPPRATNIDFNKASPAEAVKAANDLSKWLPSNQEQLNNIANELLRIINNCLPKDKEYATAEAKEVAKGNSAYEKAIIQIWCRLRYISAKQCKSH